MLAAMKGKPQMEYGIGVDASLGLSFAESRALVAEAARLGYSSAWTPSGPPVRDGFQMCAQWHGATTDIVDGGLTTGIAVIPVPVWTVQALAQQAGALSALTGGRFSLAGSLIGAVLIQTLTTTILTRGVAVELTLVVKAVVVVLVCLLQSEKFRAAIWKKAVVS